jgi:hypothetical protein
MVRVFVFLAAVQLILVVLALISALAAERVRTMPRALWVLVILVVPLIGPGAYFAAGRPVLEQRPVPRPPGRPSAPDDDPEFLRTLKPDRARRDRELLEKWERDMKRQSDEAARRDAAEAARKDAAETERRDEATRRDETPPTEV